MTKVKHGGQDEQSAVVGVTLSGRVDRFISDVPTCLPDLERRQGVAEISHRVIDVLADDIGKTHVAIMGTERVVHLNLLVDDIGTNKDPVHGVSFVNDKVEFVHGVKTSNNISVVRCIPFEVIIEVISATEKAVHQVTVENMGLDWI